MDALDSISETKPNRYAAVNKGITTDPPRIIVAEDDEEMAFLLVRAFKKAGYAVNVCHNGWDLLKILGVLSADEKLRNVSLVVSDIRLPGISGLDALETCACVDECPPIILITAFGSQWVHERARELGAVDTLDKPLDIDDLVDRVRQLVPPPL